MIDFPEYLRPFRPQIEAIAARFAVRRLAAFGSVVKGNFVEDTSDLDFVVRFDPPQNMGAADQYFGLKEALEELFGREVDLVDGDAVQNPYFKAELRETAVDLYAA